MVSIDGDPVILVHGSQASVTSEFERRVVPVHNTAAVKR